MSGSITVEEPTHAEHFILAHGLGLNTIRVRGYAGVDLDLTAGQAHGVCAEHASGKTELLLTLAGRMRASEGTLAVAGRPIAAIRDVDHLRRMAGLAFFDNLNEVARVLSVRTVTSAELNLAGRPSRRADTLAYLAAWGLDNVADTLVGDLARPSFDLLGIALGMVGDPAILVVHDVERDLTEHQTLRLVHTLRELAATRGTTVICGVTDYDVAVAFDSVTCMSDAARAQRAGFERAHGKEVA